MTSNPGLIQKKEDEERMALDSFRANSQLLAGAVTRMQPDPPDFLIMDGGRRVGVEMTRYHHDAGSGGSKAAKREALERRVMAAARIRFEALKPNVPISVNPYFREGTLRRGNVPVVADRLAKLVAQIIPPVPLNAEHLSSLRADWDTIERAELGEVLVALSVYRWVGTSSGQWHPPVGGYLNIDVADIERPLRDKEKDLPQYKAIFDECWLIIYAPPLHASSFFDFEALTPHMFSSAFDRVAFVDVSLGRYVLVA